MVKQLVSRLRSLLNSQTLVFLILLLLFLVNALHEQYPDEFDNILGGWYILHGRLIYTGFFTHHNPIAYVIAAAIELFSSRNFVIFRFLYSGVLFSFIMWTYTYFRSRFGKQYTTFYLLFIALIGFSATYFWGHMLLADNIAAYCLVPVFGLLTLLTLEKKSLLRKDIVFISVLTAIATLSALTYVYLAVTIYLYMLYYAYRTSRYKQFFSLGIISGIPYVVFLLYLLLSGSFSAWLTQAIIFNGKYYAYNYPGIGQGQFVNPFTYLLIILHNFYNNFYFLLKQVKDFNFNYPVNITLAIANVALCSYLLVKKHYALAGSMLLILAFANVRSNPLESGERDYQGAVYIVTSLFSLSFSLLAIYRLLKEDLGKPQRMLMTVIFFFLTLYGFFGITFFIHYFGDRAFLKYMNLEAKINNHHVNVSAIINAAAGKQDYMWIGPFAFQELWYTNGMLPSRYHILLPEFAQDTTIKEQMMSDFETHKPIVIYFDEGVGIRGHLPYVYAPFFINFLHKNYITLYEYHTGKTIYKSVDPITIDKDVERKLFILKSEKDIVIQRLLRKRIIKKETL
ncbi:MAG: hypothetical protein KGJ07_04180 [Patescibacteria group bacterium]|nr:hypothetical protein [Patescibacteria group bacterium]